MNPAWLGLLVLLAALGAILAEVFGGARVIRVTITAWAVLALVCLTLTGLARLARLVTRRSS